MTKPLPVGDAYAFWYDRNSVNGITLSWCGKNNSNKTVNYYTVNVTFVDPVGNPTADEITHKSTDSVRYVGPVAPGKEMSVYKLIGYVPGCKTVRIDTITLEYSDGTKEVVPYGQSTSKTWDDILGR